MRLLRIVLPALLCTLIVSCTMFDPSDSKSGIIGTETAGSGSEQASPEMTDDSPIVLGPGDEIDISVWRNDDLHRTVKIDASGRISLPLAGRIKASGLTVDSLSEKVSAALSKYVLDPKVDINVVNMRSLRAYVLGEVESPGDVVLDGNIRIWEAVSRSGGFNRDANRDKVLLVRPGDGSAEVSVVDLSSQRLFSGGKVVSAPFLRSGDIVYVPRSLPASAELFMQRLNGIVSPFVTLERGIVLEPQVMDVLQGKDDENTRVIVAP